MAVIGKGHQGKHQVQEGSNHRNTHRIASKRSHLRIGQSPEVQAVDREALQRKHLLAHQPTIAAGNPQAPCWCHTRRDVVHDRRVQHTTANLRNCLCLLGGPTPRPGDAREDDVQAILHTLAQKVGPAGQVRPVALTEAKLRAEICVVLSPILAACAHSSTHGPAVLLEAEPFVFGNDLRLLVVEKVVVAEIGRLLLQAFQDRSPSGQRKPQFCLLGVHAHDVDARPVLRQEEILRVNLPTTHLVVWNGPQNVHDLRDRCLAAMLSNGQALDILQYESPRFVCGDVSHHTVEDAGMGTIKTWSKLVQHGEVLARKASDVNVQVAGKEPRPFSQHAMRNGASCKEVCEQGLGRTVLHYEFPRRRHDVAGEHVVGAEIQTDRLPERGHDFAQREYRGLGSGAIRAEPQAPGRSTALGEGCPKVVPEHLAHLRGPRRGGEPLPRPSATAAAAGANAARNRAATGGGAAAATAAAAGAAVAAVRGHAVVRLAMEASTTASAAGSAPASATAAASGPAGGRGFVAFRAAATGSASCGHVLLCITFMPLP
mmetsp:Transcript_110126/g.350889  ORF Transcript_110126/g.350889 Transcript_110126/m.350889 type:complete len:544 (-) Transcript_110126:477-2108(-)